MSGGLYDLATWVEPFGLFRHERRTGNDLWEGSDLPLVLLTWGVVLALDVLTLPLALLGLVGVGERSSSPDRET